MAHPQQASFCSSVRARFPQHFTDCLVLDVGSLDVNGNNQFLFDRCGYIGIDVAYGKNVDFAIPGHEFRLPDASFDTIISTECFEHDRSYPATLANIVRLLKPGGMFLFTCATTGRAEHGTRRTTPEDAPLLAGLGGWDDYYKNLEEADIRAALDLDGCFASYEFSIGAENHDLYFWGIKKGERRARTDHSFQVAREANRPSGFGATIRSIWRKKTGGADRTRSR